MKHVGMQEILEEGCALILLSNRENQMPIPKANSAYYCKNSNRKQNPELDLSGVSTTTRYLN
jgi:hypothetical protein